MIGMAILQPVVVLAAWTMVMWVWMYATRLPAMRAAQIDTRNLVGSTPGGLDAMLPDKVQWKAHNYNHLHEAPTVFYAVAIVLAIIGAGDGANAVLGWVYVGLRIVHSLVQALVNVVIWRFSIFMLASVVLLILAIRLAMIVL